MTPRLSIVIPTHRRVEALAACLQTLQAQTTAPEEFEVLVVNDGGPPEEHAQIERTVHERFGSLPITLWRQERSGPARARNAAVARARAPLVLMLNDDVTLAPDHLAAHLRAHAEAPEEHVVFRGVTVWADDSPDTAVMRWMRANTFRYDWTLFHPSEAHFVHFHTCDLSMKRSLLEEFPFDETFDAPCLEDTDLALRLLRAGRLELRLLPEARSWHHHPHTFAALCRRARMQGRATALLLERHPQLEFRLFSGYLRLASQPRRLARSLAALATGRVQRFLSDLSDFLMLREIARRHARPPGDGMPYPEVLLQTFQRPPVKNCP